MHYDPMRPGRADLTSLGSLIVSGTEQDLQKVASATAEAIIQGLRDRFTSVGQSGQGYALLTQAVTLDIAARVAGELLRTVGSSSSSLEERQEAFCCAARAYSVGP